MNRLKIGDNVVILAGKDKGKTGKILKILSTQRALVDNVNLVIRHTKPNPQQGVTGGRVTKEAPIHVSNIALMNTSTNKADRVGIKVLADGKKVRFFKSDGEVVDV